MKIYKNKQFTRWQNKNKIPDSVIAIAMKQTYGWVFLFGFSKNESDNISDKELIALKEYTNDYLFANFYELLKIKEIIEVIDNE